MPATSKIPLPTKANLKKAEDFNNFFHLFTFNFILILQFESSILVLKSII